MYKQINVKLRLDLNIHKQDNKTGNKTIFCWKKTTSKPNILGPSSSAQGKQDGKFTQIW